MDLDVMLCDYAQVAGDKLFINGANINVITVAAGAPAPFVLNFAAGGVISVPYTATNQEHTLTFVFETEDSEPPKLPDGVQVGGPDGSVGGEMRFNVGRPPGLTAGQEQIIPFAFNFQGLPLMDLGRYVLIFAIDGTEVRRLPIALRMQPPTGFTMMKS